MSQVYTLDAVAAGVNAGGQISLYVRHRNPLWWRGLPWCYGFLSLCYASLLPQGPGSNVTGPYTMIETCLTRELGVPSSFAKGTPAVQGPLWTNTHSLETT